MFIGSTILVIVVWASWSIWSKLCDIEQKLFRISDEVSLSLQNIEKEIDLMQTTIERIDDNTDDFIDVNKP